MIFKGLQFIIKIFIVARKYGIQYSDWKNILVLSSTYYLIFIKILKAHSGIDQAQKIKRPVTLKKRRAFFNNPVYVPTFKAVCFS